MIRRRVSEGWIAEARIAGGYVDVMEPSSSAMGEWSGALMLESCPDVTFADKLPIAMTTENGRIVGSVVLVQVEWNRNDPTESVVVSFVGTGAPEISCRENATNGVASPEPENG